MEVRHSGALALIPPDKKKPKQIHDRALRRAVERTPVRGHIRLSQSFGILMQMGTA